MVWGGRGPAAYPLTTEQVGAGCQSHGQGQTAQGTLNATCHTPAASASLPWHSGRFPAPQPADLRPITPPQPLEACLASQQGRGTCSLTRAFSQPWESAQVHSMGQSRHCPTGVPAAGRAVPAGPGPLLALVATASSLAMLHGPLSSWCPPGPRAYRHLSGLSQGLALGPESTRVSTGINRLLREQGCG